MTEAEAIKRMAAKIQAQQVVIDRHETELAEQRAEIAKLIHYVDAMRKLFFQDRKTNKKAETPRNGRNWVHFDPSVYHNRPYGQETETDPAIQPQSAPKVRDTRPNQLVD